MSTNKMLEAALSYATRGLNVFPVTPNQKTPAGSLVPNGYKDATMSFDQIKSWWSQFPNANIGLNLERSGLVCIDIDNYKPECEFNAFIQDRDLPKTLMQKSASSGTHLIYKANEGEDFEDIW